MSKSIDFPHSPDCTYSIDLSKVNLYNLRVSPVEEVVDVSLVSRGKVILAVKPEDNGYVNFWDDWMFDRYFNASIIIKMKDESGPPKVTYIIAEPDGYSMPVNIPSQKWTPPELKGFSNNNIVIYQGDYIDLKYSKA